MLAEGTAGIRRLDAIEAYARLRVPGSASQWNHDHGDGDMRLRFTQGSTECKSCLSQLSRGLEEILTSERTNDPRYSHQNPADYLPPGCSAVTAADRPRAAEFNNCELRELHTDIHLRVIRRGRRGGGHAARRRKRRMHESETPSTPPSAGMFAKRPSK